MAFLDSWKSTLNDEKGFSDNPKDRGGPTNHGITERVARANGYAGDMRELKVEDARQIAKKQYWDVMRLDDVAALSPGIASELFDTGYNMGPVWPIRFLQRALNVLNKEGNYYGDLTVDGIIGPITINALRAYLKIRGKNGETVMLRALDGLQLSRYFDITEADPDQEEFIYGWILNRVGQD